MAEETSLWDDISSLADDISKGWNELTSSKSLGESIGTGLGAAAGGLLGGGAGLAAGAKLGQTIGGWVDPGKAGKAPASAQTPPPDMAAAGRGYASGTDVIGADALILEMYRPLYSAAVGWSFGDRGWDRQVQIELDALDPERQEFFRVNQGKVAEGGRVDRVRPLDQAGWDFWRDQVVQRIASLWFGSKDPQGYAKASALLVGGTNAQGLNLWEQVMSRGGVQLAGTRAQYAAPAPSLPPYTPGTEWMVAEAFRDYYPESVKHALGQGVVIEETRQKEWAQMSPDLREFFQVLMLQRTEGQGIAPPNPTDLRSKALADDVVRYMEKVFQLTVSPQHWPTAWSNALDRVGKGVTDLVPDVGGWLKWAGLALGGLIIYEIVKD